MIEKNLQTTNIWKDNLLPNIYNKKIQAYLNAIHLL
jgi:hypothetical protein